ncbi:MAG TPA: hypothetical protein VLC74_12705 [Rhizomicrobium sp.]|nr:hypothetical protein [Rhizomicrobium sp.]
MTSLGGRVALTLPGHGAGRHKLICATAVAQIATMLIPESAPGRVERLSLRAAVTA